MPKQLASFALLVLLSASSWAGPQTVTLAVSKMTCAACPLTVKKALSRVPGVMDVSVSFETKRAIVVFEDTRTSVAALTRATAEAGYPSTLQTEGGR